MNRTSWAALLASAAVCLAVHATTVTAAEPGLLAHYDLSEGSGGTLKDRSGHVKAAVIHGAAWVVGTRGSALRFDGTDDYVDCGKIPALDTVKALTIEMWVYRERAAGPSQYMLYENYDCLGVSDPNCTGEYQLSSNFPGKWMVIVHSKKAAPLNRWTHVAFTWDLRGGNAAVYYNGVKTASSSGKTGRASPGDKLVLGGIRSRIGKKPAVLSNGFSGLLGEVRLYNQVVPQAQIKARAEAEPEEGAGEEGLLAYFDFEEGSGNVARDKSGNANDATLVGPVWVEGKRGSALKFDGTDDYLLGRKGTVTKDVRAMTVELWIYRERPGRHQYILYEHPDRLAVYEAYGSGKYRLISNLTGKWSDIVRAKDVAPLHQWTHVAFTWDMETGDARVYYNGVERGSATGKTAKAVHGDYLSMGGIVGKKPEKPATVGLAFRGMIDEVRIYDRVLSRQEIKRHIKGY